MEWYAYVFEARSVQSYLFSGGKLADMVAASDLLDDLTESRLDEALRALDLSVGKDLSFVRRAGGAFYAIAEKEEGKHALMRLQALWSLCIAQWLPGIESVQALCGGNTAYAATQKGIAMLAVERNRPTAELPVPGPFVQRSPRTGGAAVRLDDKELIDAALANQRAYIRSEGQDRLVKRFIPPDNDVITTCHWPRNLEKVRRPGKQDFPFVGDEADIAVVHVDGNGLGQLLQVLGRATRDDAIRYPEIFSAFSSALTLATTLAAATATAQVLFPAAESNQQRVMPARPLVLGGDDLTMIIRADLAVEYVEKFIIAFESLSETGLKKLALDYPVLAIAPDFPNRLTACGGIAFIKSGQPFLMGYHVAESMCAQAKKISRENATQSGVIPSSLAFYRVSGALADDYESLRERVLTVTLGENTKACLSMGAYAVGAMESNMPRLEGLRQLLGTLTGTGASREGVLTLAKLRQLSTLLHVAPIEADIFWRRLQNHAAKAFEASGTKSALDRFQAKLKAMVPDADIHEGVFLKRKSIHEVISPLEDLLALAGAEGAE